tara:strand:+ start:122 stop:247 length:126 start_codon:yes stop_codon:yes gene_type:complete
MTQIQPFIPAILGGILSIFAILGIREFLKESAIAFRNTFHA